MKNEAQINELRIYSEKHSKLNEIEDEIARLDEILIRVENGPELHKITAAEVFWLFFYFIIIFFIIKYVFSKFFLFCFEHSLIPYQDIILSYAVSNYATQDNLKTVSVLFSYPIATLIPSFLIVAYIKQTKHENQELIKKTNEDRVHTHDFIKKKATLESQKKHLEECFISGEESKLLHASYQGRINEIIEFLESERTHTLKETLNLMIEIEAREKFLVEIRDVLAEQDDKMKKDVLLILPFFSEVLSKLDDAKTAGKEMNGREGCLQFIQEALDIQDERINYYLHTMEERANSEKNDLDKAERRLDLIRSGLNEWGKPLKRKEQ